MMRTVEFESSKQSDRLVIFHTVNSHNNNKGYTRSSWTRKLTECKHNIVHTFKEWRERAAILSYLTPTTAKFLERKLPKTKNFLFVCLFLTEVTQFSVKTGSEQGS